uniref:GAG-POL n=1 Tax=Oryza sativa subsp. japonica TaxID=39947 RepID=Q84SR2_ORYSJ|nr:putative GAG-POL precursor [Oryza sativa Japonica Group]
MNPLDIPKTSFITPFGTFCHLRMPFGLRNAGATFARLVYKVLGKQLGRNVEAYIDDIVLNPKKCVFGVRAGKLLGFIVFERGIEANPEKIDAIQQMKPPSSVHEVQKLAGRIAALSRFLSKAAERGLPFFKTLRGAGKFNWTPECQAAFDELKQYLQSLPALISPPLGSDLLLYLAASPVAVSAALVQETEFGQKPVYFVSEALQGAKTRYIEMEKLAYALVMASRKLKHYFQAHKVIMPTQYPLGEILRGKEVTGRLSKWAAELSPFDLHFVARSAIKSQGAGIAAVLFSPNGVPIRYAARLQFDTTNNAAEYEAVLLGLRKMVSGKLYRSGVLQPLFRCISFAEGEEMAKEIHQGLCGAHQAARTVASKVFRQGVYWPTVLKVCVEQIKKCESCQRHGRSQAAPQYNLQPIAPIWPFARWGLDIIGPFPVARNGYKFVIVAVEYFSRWIEAEPLGAITSAAVQKFVWKNIVCRFGVPKEFITDNGKQFDSDKFREMCEGLNLEIRFASVAVVTEKICIFPNASVLVPVPGKAGVHHTNMIQKAHLYYIDNIYIITKALKA